VDGSSLFRSPGPDLNQTDPNATSGTPGLSALVAVRTWLASGVVGVLAALTGVPVSIGVDGPPGALTEPSGVVAPLLHPAASNATHAAVPSSDVFNRSATARGWLRMTRTII
jgi:hypothetical protein